MNEVSETVKNEVTEVCEKMSGISDYRIKADYDVTMRLVDKKSGEDGGCAHHFKGSINRNLLCTVALAAAGLGMVGAVICLFHTCCKVCDRAK